MIRATDRILKLGFQYNLPKAQILQNRTWDTEFKELSKGDRGPRQD